MFRHRLEEKERKIYIPPLPLLRMSLHTKWKNVHHVQRTVYIFLLGNVFLTFSPDAYASSSIFARNERLLVPVYIRISNSEDASGEIRTAVTHFFFSSHQFLCLSTNFSSPHRNKIPHSLIVDQMYSITYSLLIEIIIDLQNLIFEILLSERRGGGRKG